LSASHTLLVVAGEASGDAMAAPVVARLSTSSFGIGGRALRAVGTELSADLSNFTAMGLGAVVMRSPAIGKALVEIARQVRRRRPRAALLVGYSEFNAHLGPWLRGQGIPVLWYGAPQIWAWRPGRAPAIAAACDRMAVILPFEQELWRTHGVDAHYVGHPVLERAPSARADVRERFGLTPYAEYVAVLPGSRPHEIEEHIEPMAAAVGRVRAERGALDARLVLAPSLDGKTSDYAKRVAQGHGISVLQTQALDVLPAFDVALAASGTVTLECAAAGVPPVVVYKSGAITHFFAKRLVQVKEIALPNIVLGRLVFPELLQERVTPELIAEQCTRLLEQHAEFVEQCRLVRSRLLSSLPEGPKASRHSVVSAPLAERPSERVARLIAPWLASSRTGDRLG
jgi:lipid-A-disaccharide synthase